MDFDGDLSVAYALWKRGVAPSEDLVDTATRALVDGLDTPSLRELAGVRVDDAPYEAPALCEATLRELGLEVADERRSLRLLACGIARRIVNGDEPEFRGASRLWRIFMGPDHYPDFAGHLIGLEDEWEGRWGRTEAELRDEVQSTARDILDAWGDRTSHVHRLHSAARRHLLDAFANWASRYAELQRDGCCWQVTDESTGKWHYSDEALSTFPRYRMDEAILVEVERLRPSSFRTLAALRAALLAAADAVPASDAALREPAASDERDEFTKWIANADTANASAELLPYRRTLSAEEIAERRRGLLDRWGITDSWVPMTNEPVPEGTLILDSTIWNEPDAVDALRAALDATGNTVMVSINEGRSFEVHIDAFDPAYAGEGEVIATPLFPWCLIYTSHEGTSALSKGPHLDKLRHLMPDLDRWTRLQGHRRGPGGPEAGQQRQAAEEAGGLGQ